ncbi:hypothetical protein FHW96_004916 [Novosphingobium sp. SG751A]|uniref:hypothetical protein n=1 Tax=Novosphingobium sp. SG751A TaxID=2587000 RepID=UPI0015559766|nr:hypothetical protein [Novosphingobium sp. SG751A]NOW48726.1 hypothetical protein [Novosphingobium sp. SG751A]
MTVIAAGQSTPQSFMPEQRQKRPKVSRRAWISGCGFQSEIDSLIGAWGSIDMADAVCPAKK